MIIAAKVSFLQYLYNMTAIFILIEYPAALLGVRSAF